MEVQILRFFLVTFSLVIIIIFTYFIFFNKFFTEQEKNINIIKNQSIFSIAENLTINKSSFEKKLYNLILKFYNQFFLQVKYGKFNINKSTNFFNIIKIITNKSNVDYKITIIEGWNEFQFSEYIKNFYIFDNEISYEDLFADTYIINSSNSLNDFKIFSNKNMINLLRKYKNNNLLKEYGLKKILIICSLIEKEAKNNIDKPLISSVIFNRLSKKMKLQIDASVIFALTEGKFKFDRKLNYDDLKIDHPYNTYKINGIPPGMISFVSYETFKIVLQNFKSDFLFYFYNIIEKKHIFSNNYNEHKIKLNEYRKKTK